MRKRNIRSASRSHHPRHHHLVGKNLIRKNLGSQNSRKIQNWKSIFLNQTQPKNQNRSQTLTSQQASQHSQLNRVKSLCQTSFQHQAKRISSSRNNCSHSYSLSLCSPNPSQRSTLCSNHNNLQLNPPSSLIKLIRPKLCNVNSNFRPPQLKRRPTLIASSQT